MVQDIDLIMREGDEYFIKGDFEKALLCYQNAADQGNDSALLCRGKADALYHMGKLDEAIYQCRQGVQRYPEDAELWEFLGKLLLKLENMTEGLEAYRNSVKYTPGGMPRRKIRRIIEWLEEITAEAKDKI